MRALLPLLLFCSIGSPVLADSPAKVTEAVNVVERGSGQSAKAAPAPTGTALHDGDFLKTGVKSRAELQLPTQSVTRLGANTIFNYSTASNSIDLQAGTVLFCKPKDAAQLNLKTAAVTAGITGTTGFFSIHGAGRQKTYVIGIIEGHATARAEGKSYPIAAGEILEFRPGAKAVIFPFDVPRMVHTSMFFTKFKGRLPNQRAIDGEVASYADDQRRGFIQPPSGAIDYSGTSSVPTTAFDSASSAQGQSRPMQPQTPPSYTPPGY